MTAGLALFRSVATKLARAPQLHPRPPLGRGLHGGAPSGAGGSLTPPTSNHNQMIQQGMEGMSEASKIARAQPPHPNPGASNFTPPPTINKDQIIADLRRRLSIACAAAGMGAATITGSVVYLYFWVMPDVEAISKRAKQDATSVEELAESIKDMRANVKKEAALQKDLQKDRQAALAKLTDLQKDRQAALAKLTAVVESLPSKPEGERV